MHLLVDMCTKAPANSLSLYVVEDMQHVMNFRKVPIFGLFVDFTSASDIFLNIKSDMRLKG